MSAPERPRLPELLLLPPSHPDSLASRLQAFWAAARQRFDPYGARLRLRSGASGPYFLGLCPHCETTAYHHPDPTADADGPLDAWCELCGCVAGYRRSEDCVQLDSSRPNGGDE